MIWPISRLIEAGRLYFAVPETRSMVFFMAKPDPTKDPEFKRVLGNLLNAPPKPHSEMKVGKRKSKSGQGVQRQHSGK